MEEIFPEELRARKINSLTGIALQNSTGIKAKLN